MGKKDDKIKELEQEVASAMAACRNSLEEVERYRSRADRSDALAEEWADLATKYEKRAKWWPRLSVVIAGFIVLQLLIVKLYFVQR